MWELRFWPNVLRSANRHIPINFEWTNRRRLYTWKKKSNRRRTETVSLIVHVTRRVAHIEVRSASQELRLPSRCSVLLTSPVGGFNVGADRCVKPQLARAKTEHPFYFLYSGEKKKRQD